MAVSTIPFANNVMLVIGKNSILLMAFVTNILPGSFKHSGPFLKMRVMALYTMTRYYRAVELGIFVPERLVALKTQIW
jgi:hypothetical protein